MDVYRTRKICINKQHALYQWCSTVTSLGNNLSNAVRFRQRQILTAVRKDSSSLTENEKQVIAEFKAIHKLLMPETASYQNPPWKRPSGQTGIQTSLPKDCPGKPLSISYIRHVMTWRTITGLWLHIRHLLPDSLVCRSSPATRKKAVCVR